ncbi:MAG TPA: EI24 domain-containing protein [Burkholderiales bacterium]|nr:EI24 domain-containing protein [Burkholderiales bacterium]
MQTVLDSFARALRDLRAPRVLAVLLIPPLAGLLVWGVLAWTFAEDWARWVADFIARSAWLTWISSSGLTGIFVWGSGIAALAALLPIVLITSILVAELVAMPVVVPWVAARRFPGLEARKGGTVTGSAFNAAGTIVVFLILWVVTLPLWFTGVGALVLPPLLSAFLNQRLFRYDALAEHASADERRAVLARARGRLYLLGLLLAFVYYIPLVNLAAPVLSALAFTHFCLAELARFRATRG